MGLSQESIGKLLAKAETSMEVEECLQAYCFAKSQHGNAAQVTRKLHLLTLYLRAVQLGDLLRDHYEAFAVCAWMVKTLPPTSKLAATVPRTALGAEAFNAARRPSRSLFHRVYSSKSSGSSSFSSSSSNLSSTAGSGYSSEAEVEDDQTLRRPGQGRSRSSTSNSLQFGEAAFQAQERLRMAAGAGSSHGLGVGLLSAPPVYDGGVAAYVASLPVAPRSGRPSFEDELLPDY